MALGIYKPGQGYWVRVLTATGVGIITLAAAAWAWSQMGVLADTLPSDTYRMMVSTSETPPAPGESVTLLSKPETVDGPAATVGTATVQSYAPQSNELVVTGVALDPKAASVSETKTVKTAKTQVGVQTGTLRKIPAVAEGVLQGVTASVVLLGGAILAYWMCAVRPRSSDFLIATDMEMKKVHWSTRKEIQKQTLVVIGAAVLIAGFLFVSDLAFQGFFRMIGIIKTS